MRSASPHDVVAMLDGSVDAAALGAALELGLFCLLDARPLDTTAIAEALGIPPRRCELWLRCVERTGLVQRTSGRWTPTPHARASLLATWSQATWALLAQEARERHELLADVPGQLRDPMPAAAGPSYVAKMAADPVRARRFTRMLRELHEGLADDLADALDLTEVRRVLDIGGGSGVVAMALARRKAELEAIVADIPTVCVAGAEVVGEAGLGDRVRHLALDLRRDTLPAGFDLVVECDVGLYEVDLFQRVGAALAPGGRFAIVDVLPGIGEPEPHLTWAMLASLRDPAYEPTTLESVTERLTGAGFMAATARTLPRRPGMAAQETFTLLEAHR